MTVLRPLIELAAIALFLTAFTGGALLIADRQTIHVSQPTYAEVTK